MTKKKTTTKKNHTNTKHQEKKTQTNTKEETTSIVDTWILGAPNGGARVSILSAVQLDKKLPPFIGSMVSILRGKDVNTTNGNRVTEYMVSGPKLADGQRRSWTMPKVPSRW